MNLYYQIIFFIFGTFIGSFLYVVSVRTHCNEGWIHGRSQCPKCKKELSPAQLIPLVSYIIQKGRCKNCKSEISIKYPIAELICGLLTLTVFVKFGFTIEFGVILILFYLLFILFFSDLNFFELPDQFSLPASLLAFIFTLFFTDNSVITILLSGLGGAIFFLIQYILSQGRAIGDGDIRLGLIMGFLLPFPGLFFVIVLGYIIGSCISIILLCLKRLKRDSKVPLGTFLIPSLIVTFLFYDKLESLEIVESYRYLINHL